MNRRQALALTLAAASLLAAPSHAYRMIQNNSTGRVTSGSQVTCNDAGGFTHWNTRNIIWYHNTGNQGSGKATALQNAMASWDAVTSANHNLDYISTTSAGWTTDDINTVLWASGNGCTGGCLALTALVLVTGQVIIESDITFNNDVTWNTGGTAWDTESIAAHEFGHSLGIHHTELGSAPQPTMYPTNSGDTAWRTLETDDQSALQCSESTYAPSCTAANGVCARDSDCCSGRCWIKTLPPKCTS